MEPDERPSGPGIVPFERSPRVDGDSWNHGGSRVLPVVSEEWGQVY